MGEPGSWLQADTDGGGDNAGGALRAWRKVGSRTQRQVSDQLGWSQQLLSLIENGRTTFTLDQRRHAAAVLGIAPDDLGLAAGHHASDDLSPDVAASQHEWRRQRHYLNRNRSQLAAIAATLYPPEVRLTGTPLIAPTEWLPPEPVELRSIAMSLDESRQTTSVSGSEPESAAARPLRTLDRRFDRYTDAIKHLDPPELFESRPSYRLLGVDMPARRMDFGLGAYFDKLDVSEAVGHELAAGNPHECLPFRELVDDPFDLRRRAVIPAITTLTIRLHRYPQPASFLLHWRDPAKVATAGGTYDVIPAGEFQPSSLAIWDRCNDFDLWRNMVREYSEELLGTPEHDGTRTDEIDYDRWPLYRALDAAQDDGSVQPYLLGIGLDALTLAATILTVVVIEDPVFDDLFGEMVQHNSEGRIVAVGDGTAAQGVPFTAEAVQRMLTCEPMASPGAACLALAWRHRESLLP